MAKRGNTMEYETLKRLIVELDCIFMENRYLKAENKRLREKNERYSNEMKESIKEQTSAIGNLLAEPTREIKED